MAARRIFVVGTGPVGEELVREASAHGRKITALEADPRKAEQLSRMRGVQAIHLRGASLDELREAGISRADLVLATSENDEQNMRVITYALELGVPRVGAVAADEEHREIFRRLGAETVVVPARVASERLCALFLSTSVVYDVVLNDGSRVVQIAVNEESLFSGRSPEDAGLMEEGHWIIDVVRDGEHFHPTSITSLAAGDYVTVFFAREPVSNSVLAGMLG
ncbi:TrkA family potassium uptake protein [Candidatus Bipolaricaulota bacterium]|nr:TrkA family potassium uptake protein [Candidatus Bipolaricaulota bacterium]